MSRGTCAKGGKKACDTWKKIHFGTFHPVRTRHWTKIIKWTVLTIASMFFSPTFTSAKLFFFFTSGSEQRTDRVERFPVTFSMPLLRLPLLRHKDHESVQFVRASRGVNSIKTSLQNRTRISCIIYLLYPSSKTREKNTCQLFAYKTYLNMKGRFIYF